MLLTYCEACGKPVRTDQAFVFVEMDVVVFDATGHSSTVRGLNLIPFHAAHPWCQLPADPKLLHREGACLGWAVEKYVRGLPA